MLLLIPCWHQTAGPCLRIASAVLWVEIVFVPGPRITLSHISPLLRHRKKYENMIYSSGLAPSRTKQDQAGTGNTNVIRERDISTATAAPPAILLTSCTFLVVDFCSLGIGVNYKFLLHFVIRQTNIAAKKCKRFWL